MKLKKANALLGLITIIVLLAHAGYQIAAYILFIYNPLVTKTLAWIAVAAVSVHAVLGMSIMMFSNDGSSLTQYPKANLRTILQRGSAIGIMVMLILHVKAYDILKSGTPGLAAAELIQLLFFTCVFTHIAASFSNAFVTLGFLSSMDTKKRIDRVTWTVCGVLWLAAVIVVGRTYVILASIP